MKDDDRGKIRNRKLASQLRDFSGLRYGKITPTDIDAFLDFQDKVFIFVEAKHQSAMPPTGQRIALERLCDACEKAGKLAIVLVASHDTEADIELANLPVTFIRHKGFWRKPHRPVSVREAIDDFLSWSLNNFPLDCTE